MVGKPQQRTQQTRAKILASAHELFNQAGYSATSVDQIATKAGFAKGTIFAHFPDKANLLTAVRIQNLEQLVVQMNERVAHPTSAEPTQIFVDLLSPWLNLFANDKDFTQVFLNQADLKGGPWAMRLYETCCALDAALESSVASLTEQGQLPDTTSISMYAQGVQAFFYHVLIGLHSGATANQSDQELLLRGLLTRWLSPVS